MSLPGPHPLPRRSFLGLTLSAGGAALATGCARAQTSSRSFTLASPVPSSSSLASWDAVRAQFALSHDYVHLASFLLASHPVRVAQEIERFRRELDANPALMMEVEFENRAHTTRARGAAAAYLGASPDEIALTDSTSMGLATLYNGFRLGPNDEILTTTHDHYSTHESLRLVATRTGASVRKTALYDAASAASVDAMTAALVQALTPRTRVVAITWVHSSTGVRTPVRSIADALAKAQASRPPQERAVLCVDGVHGFGVEDVTMADLGCDFFVAGCHKWMYGPRGTGLLWGRASAMSALLPTIPPFMGNWGNARTNGGGAQSPTVDGWAMTPGGFKAYEHQWALPAAFAMHQEIGKARIAARIHELNRHAKEELATMRHVKLHTPRADEISAGIVCFEVAGMKPAAVVEKLLASKIIASVTPYRPPYVRIAASLVNRHEDVDAAMRVVSSLA
jgi:isopenicillin-N epimerase